MNQMLKCLYPVTSRAPKAFRLLRDTLNALHADVARLRQNRATTRKETAVRLAALNERISLIDARVTGVETKVRGRWRHAFVAILRALVGG